MYKERFIIDDFSKKEEVNESVHNESEFLQFRTAYILKYTKTNEYLLRTEKHYELISDAQKNIALGLYDKLKKIFDKNNKVIFNKPNISETITLDVWKQMVNFFNEYSNTSTQLLSLLFTELKHSKEQILSLSKKVFEQSNELNQKKKDLNEVNGYIRKHELNNFSKKQNLHKDSDYQLKKTKINFHQKENAYIMTIFRLEEEIKDLTKLLNANQINCDKIKKAQDVIEESKNHMEQMQMHYSKKINDVNIQNGVFRDEIEMLKEQVMKLEESNAQLLATKDEQLKIIIERTAEKKNLRNQLDDEIQKNKELQEIINKYEKEEKEGQENKREFMQRMALIKENEDNDSNENDF